MHSKSTWIVLLGIFLSCPVRATEACRNCRSVDLQLAPGIGVEVALDYLTSAAVLVNGTIIDFVHLPGSDEYKALMHNTAAEAEGIQDGVGVSRSWMPWLNELGNMARWRHEHRMLAYLGDRYPSLYLIFSTPPTPLLNADDRVQILVQELTRLKALSEAQLGTLINETSISFPSITKLLGQNFAGYIRQSFASAGFLVLTDNNGIAVQHAALSTVEITVPTLGLEYSGAALCLSMQLPNVEQPEYLHLERVGVWAALGSGFEKTPGHWARLTMQVQDFLADLDLPHRSVIQVLVTGMNSASSSGLHQVIADIFPDIGKNSYERESPDDYIFAAARGAARRARQGMLHGEDLCMPDPSCQLAEGHPWKRSQEL